MSLILKNKKGKVIEKCGYDEQDGNIFYKEKKVGVFELEHDSALGSYYLYTIDNGKQYHDHYLIEETIIEDCDWIIEKNKMQKRIKEHHLS